MSSHLSDVIDCLYDTYVHQKSHLRQYGYSDEEIFWINFASVPFMPWSEKDQNIVPLTHLIKFYNMIYDDEVRQGKKNISKFFVRCLLQSKFNLTYALAKRALVNELNLPFALDVGRCVFPHFNDTYKIALSGLVIINTKPIFQRRELNLSFGRLVRDINRNYLVGRQEVNVHQPCN